MNALEKLGREWVFFDGGTGSLLQKAGLQPGEKPETWNLTHPDRIRKVHQDYLEAGCDVVMANTFGLNALRFPGQVAEIASDAVSLARQARDLARRPDAAVAIDLGPTGRLLRPMGDLDFEEAVALYREVAAAGRQAGADLVMIETMGDSLETKAAVLGAREGCELPICATLVFDEGGKMLTGGTPESMTAMLEGLRVAAIGVNCSLGPRQMLPIVRRMAAVSSLPIIVNPNAGLPRVDTAGRTVYDIGPEEFARWMREIAQAGAHALGGCCGTTPEYLRKTIELCRPLPFSPPTPRRRTVVSSFSRAVSIGEKPVLIGERINPTGKKRLKEALRAGDIDALMAEGLAQEEAGADVLDVNVGLPEIDEPTLLPQVVSRLQSLVPLPLQIDTSDPLAMERALRIYNGKPLINSVSGKRESMDAIFPLAARYGGVVVALLLDENGIPEDAAGRVAIARRIRLEAERYGIPPEDLVFDALALAVSSSDRAAAVTLETLRALRDELGAHSILGVSNVSFGLPQRPLINAAFLTMALENGLRCAIVNPLNPQMMDGYRAWLALRGLDPRCEGLIAAFAGRESRQDTPADAMPLREAILRGLGSRVREQTRSRLAEAGSDPLRLIDEELIPALDEAGRGFEAGTVFLPQLLMCAEAAGIAFEEVKRLLPDASRAARGRVILATVKGDIHDIGKNIVRALLENYGYQVLDLGKDVPPRQIVDCALRENIRLVGLSALMTTTVGSMAETIALLRQEAPGARVVVGGAVLTEEYARSIGADCYAKDAMATVRYADAVFAQTPGDP